MPTYHLTYKTVDWNFLWATPEQMKVAWRAIEDGDVSTLRDAISSNPKIARWEDSSFFDRFGHSKQPTLELLDCIIEAMGPIEEYEHGDSKFFRPSTLHAEVSREAAEILLTRGANVNANAGFGYTPLGLAVDQGRVNLVKLYLAAGAETKYQNPEQKTPLQAAIDSSNHEIEDLLRNAGTPRSGVPCLVWRSKPESSVQISLDSQTEVIKTAFAEAVERWSEIGNGSVGTVAVDVSGVKGYVRVGIATAPIEPYAPDCCAEVATLVNLEFDSWSEAHRQNQQVVAEVAGKKHSATDRSLFGKRDKPFYTFVRGLFTEAMKSGVFDNLDTSDQTIYACQSFYFHHCDCWNHRKKKIAVPREWSATGQRKAKGKATVSSKTADSERGMDAPRRIFKTSAGDIVYAERLNGWAFRNSTSLWKIEDQAKKPSQRIPLKNANVPLSINDQGTHLLTGSGDDFVCVDLNTWEVVSRLPMEPCYGDLSCLTTCHGSKGDWLFHSEYSSDPITRVQLSQNQGLRKRSIQLPEEILQTRLSTVRYHPPSGLLAMKLHLDKVIHVGFIEDDAVTVLRSVNLESDLAVIYDFAWSPQRKQLIVRGEDRDEDMLLLAIDVDSESRTAATSLGNAELAWEIRYAPDGRHFALRVNSSVDQVAKNRWPQRETVVIFDAESLDYRSHLPVEDIACYAWSRDGNRMLVGGYKESTLWSIDHRLDR